ncbi:MAG: pseudouridine-5'-phosphate glycosidase [Anaerolineae bacterium]
MNEDLVLAPKIEHLLAQGGPVVALESALITHGFAYPASLEITREMATAIRAAGAEAAAIGIWEGMPLIGLNDLQIDRLAADSEAVKVSVRDLPLTRLRASSGSGNGGTTVAATALLAQRAGIRVFATGGIGGVHRRHPEDISADLPVLATTPIVVVCAGAKSILDLPRTLEYLETWGVPVVGWRTEEFPAFYSRHSGLPVDASASSTDDIVDIYRRQQALGLPQALLVTVPVPAEHEVPAEVVEPLIAQAVAEAEAQGVTGKDVTPFILARLVSLSEAKTRRANQSLLIQNAEVAAKIAVALAESESGPPCAP